MVSLKNSCDVYADMILNSATDEEAKTLTNILNLTLSPEEKVLAIREAQAGSAF